MHSLSALAKRAHLIVPLTALFAFGTTAIAPALPIDTGYNYLTYGAYPAPPLSGNSSIQDNYWINVASYQPPSMSATVAPAFVIKDNSPWSPPYTPNSRWISALPTWNSSPGSSGNDHAWTLFRKCFCLAPNFNSATLSFRARHDESLQIMLNSMTNVLYGPAPANFNWTVPVVNVPPAKLQALHAGKNCLYVLLEDTGGAMGWDLTGDFNANGLYPYAAAGAQQSFPCDCGAHPGPVPYGTSATAARSSMQADDSDVIAGIVKLAESRRKAKVQKRN
jgi:hypothetical protein